VIAVDIFRERVFLRSEEHGSRIIPLLQLKGEVEGLGEVLVTAEYRARVAAEAAAAAADSENEPDTQTGAEGPDRRRRRRGGGNGEAPQAPGSP
jgi:hypothetical protein